MVHATHHYLDPPLAAVHVVHVEGGCRITPRESEVLVLVAQGRSAKEIAQTLSMAPRTVDQHIVNLKMKTRARNRAHMVTIAMCQGLLEPDLVCSNV